MPVDLVIPNEACEPYDPKEVEVLVSGPVANRMFIYTGYILFHRNKPYSQYIPGFGTVTSTFPGVKGVDQGWSHYRIVGLRIKIIRPPIAQVHSILATGSLTSFSNDGYAVNAGWALDQIWAQVEPRGSEGNPLDPPGSSANLYAILAVRDQDGYIDRMGYQVTVLAGI